MSKKPTSLALSIIILQSITWINIAIFILYFVSYIYALELGFMHMMVGEKLIKAFLALIFAILLYFTTKGLLNQKKWARIITIILGVLILFGYTIETTIGLLLIYGTTKGWPEK
ncbi:hypothetical protein [Sulfurospirillum arcachonense]|uniref:hypothetical protein n=1 Tax=Sulfurospirillum arcachonense TaxID=57666 RepID=UPI0004698385|nr:hypothetical protein [Sulfurospirillum arcachonense]